MNDLKKIFGCLWLMVLAFGLSGSLALAQTAARVYLQPVNPAAGVLTVEVMAENVTNLYGAEFRIKYDPAVVSVQDVQTDQAGIQIEPGSLLPVTQGFVVANQVKPEEGTITFALTLLNPAPAVSGSGPLARIMFNVLQDSPSTIDLEHVKLVSVDLQTIPTQVAGLTIGRQPPEQQPAAGPPATNLPPTSGGSEFPWWIVAAFILLVGFLTLAGLIALGWGRSDINLTPAQVPVRQPVRPSGRRPSAFRPPTFE
uniref:Cohesin domain-containing protein n=1 Tax=uncultured Chloroflexota bacterium TaxID=166587 RepID=H5SN27_9CHLR|nr:hypothetical protein HGMM_F51E07C08 [uncultured Chloroflexota bacterium]